MLLIDILLLFLYEIDSYKTTNGVYKTLTSLITLTDTRNNSRASHSQVGNLIEDGCSDLVLVTEVILVVWQKWRNIE